MDLFIFFYKTKFRTINNNGKQDVPFLTESLEDRRSPRDPHRNLQLTHFGGILKIQKHKERLSSNLVK